MKRVAGIFLFALLAACGGEAPEAPEPAVEETTADPRAPVVVYASYEDGNYLPQWFTLFTEATGIRVQVRTRDQATNVTDVIANRGTPPADILIVDDVYELWRAADEGALRPLRVDNLDELVDSRFQDPDGQWAAFSVRTAVVVFRPDEFDPQTFPGYSDLGQESLRGRLCLSTSRLPVNRALIAMLIDELGVRPAEIVVREWVRNLAAEPFDSDEALLDALAAGTCGVGIVSSQAANARYRNDQSFFRSMHFPDPSYGNIEGIAVVRHAHEPDKANRLIAWMLHEANQRRHSMATDSAMAGPIDPGPIRHDMPSIYDLQRWSLAGREVSVAGWRGEEAILLAQRARYR